jgi:predicted signal transduction protein with EAL and GGDEF domain
MYVLHRLGCGVMQGYLFSRPIPADDVETWLAQTVLPRKAPWIGQAGHAGHGEGGERPAEVRNGGRGG